MTGGRAGTQMTAEIAALVRERGPLTGAELRAALPGNALELWRSCVGSPELLVRRVGQRYLRLDRQVEGYARMSPSILREFMTYSVVGLAADPAAVERRVQAVSSHTQQVTRAKHELARKIVAEVVGPLRAHGLPTERYCVLLAGDIVYEMAHDVPRPERSTGKLVNGSDLDLVFIVDDDLPEAQVAELDRAILWRKHRLLRDPAGREEIDYIVKRLGRMREQAGFDDFKRMVACKILHEGVFLYGSQALFAAAKSLLIEHGVVDKLDALVRSAETTRLSTEALLARSAGDEMTEEQRSLLYTADESEEFE